MGHTGKYVLRFWGLSFTEINYMKFVNRVKNLRMYVKVEIAWEIVSNEELHRTRGRGKWRLSGCDPSTFLKTSFFRIACIFRFISVYLVCCYKLFLHCETPQVANWIWQWIPAKPFFEWRIKFLLSRQPMPLEWKLSCPFLGMVWALKMWVSN